jgi:hypothetical protein
MCYGISGEMKSKVKEEKRLEEEKKLEEENEEKRIRNEIWNAMSPEEKIKSELLYWENRRYNYMVYQNEMRRIYNNLPYPPICYI